MGVHDEFGHSGPGGDLITEFGLRAANIVQTKFANCASNMIKKARSSTAGPACLTIPPFFDYDKSKENNRKVRLWIWK